MHPPEIERARYLRNNMTKAEWFVWSRLRNRQMAGCKFRRQVPIGPYFADFVCKAARFVLEIDGEGHDGDRDDRKTAWLEEHGYRVLRIGAYEVDESIDDVMDTVFTVLTLAPSSADLPHPAPPASRSGPTFP